MLEKFIDVLIMVSIDLEIGLHNYQHTFQRYRIVIINTDIYISDSESIILDVIMFIFFYYSILHVPYFSIVYTQYDILVSRT